MKYLKILGLAILAAALTGVAGASTASATELDCGTSACAAGASLKAETEGALAIDRSTGEEACKKSKLEATISGAGGSTETVKAEISSLTFTECNATTTVLFKGSLEFHTNGLIADGNGTLTSSGTEITQELAGFHCIFKTSSTDLGTVTGSSTTKELATLDIAATIPRTGGRSGAFCGSTAQWTGAYKFTSPTVLNVT